MKRRKSEKFKQKPTWYQKQQRWMQIKLILFFAVVAAVVGLAFYYYSERKSLAPYAMPVSLPGSLMAAKNLCFKPVATNQPPPASRSKKAIKPFIFSGFYRFFNWWVGGDSNPRTNALKGHCSTN